MEILSESDHAKNVSNFGSLLVSLEVLGDHYNPSGENLKLPQLKLLHAQAKTVMQGVALSLRVYAAAVDSRKKAWDGMDVLSGRIKNLCQEADVAEKSSVTTLLKNVRGDESLIAEKVRVGRSLKFNAVLASSSFEKRLDDFNKLILMLSRSDAALSDKGTLLIASLEALQSNLKSKNINVKLAEAALNTARSNRDTLLYRRENNLLKVAKEVKDYIKTTLGPSYAQYIQIINTDFKNN